MNDIFTIQYDDFGRKNQTTSPDTGTTKYQYDPAGNLIQRADAKGTIVNYTYDALNRLAAIQFPADPNQNVTFTYDSPSVTYGIGRLTGRVDPSGTYSFHSDAHGNLTREEKTINNILYTTQFGYDKNNILSTITYPSGRTVTYIPDGAGRIFEVRTVLSGQPKTLATSISYLPFGWITGLTYGNSLTLTQGYDNQYRVSSILRGSIFNLTFGYDPNGNIISIVDAINPTRGRPGLEPFETYSYQPGTNKLIHIETTPPIDFGYDANANITSETGWTYIYDLSNQLIRVLAGSNVVGEYTFNGAGQRIKKVVQGTTRIFHYDLQGHLIAETNQSGQMLAEYIYLGDQLLAMIKPGEVAYYYHNDHLGTPQVLTDATGNIAWKATYDPFGEATISGQAVENPFRFPGQYYDQETGLHYNYFRYYDPTTGRYVTPDPIGLGGGINLFAYVAGNPVNWADPLGLELIQVNLPGLGVTYLDDRFAPMVNNFIVNAAASGVNLHFNYTYRTPEQQRRLCDDPSAITPAEQSLHSAGFAVDINYSSLRDTPGGLTGAQQRQIIRNAARAAGLSWGGNFRSPDPPHFYFEPGGNRVVLIRDAFIRYIELTGRRNQ